LVASYARRGAPLPLVLDDVLVNFDAERAKAAAAVLRDFAAAGHQLVVFTCHEHILKLFKSLRVPVGRLPGNAAPGPAVVSLEHRREEPPQRERQAPPPRKVVAKAKPKKRREPGGAFDADYFESENVEKVEEDEGEDAVEGDDESDEEEDGETDEDDSLWEGDEEEYEEMGNDIAAA
jgi:hypothetical protein